MQRADAFSLVKGTLPAGKPKAAFKIVILYEDVETGKLAKQTYDFLVESMGSDCRFTHQIWKFEALGLPALLEVAARDAVDANMVVVSGQSGDLPGHVLSWLETWIEQAVHPLALVALFDPSRDTPQTQALRAFLSSLAERGGVEFFTPSREATDSSLAKRDSSFPSRSEWRGHSWGTYIAADEDYRGVTHWGINE
jgi:hypothetical protein